MTSSMRSSPRSTPGPPRICTTIVNSVTCQYFVNGVRSLDRRAAERARTRPRHIVDPIVLELPATATNIAATFVDGSGNSGNLLVYPRLSACRSTTPTR